MEKELKSLISTCDKESRMQWASDWQKNGKKVIGILDNCVPEEVIYAAGMLPWRIQGTWQGDISRATVYRIPQSSSFLNHVMESFLRGEMDFLDGMVCSNRDHDSIRLWDAWERLGNMQLVYLIDVPITDTEATRQRFAAEIRKFISAVEEFGKTDLTDSSLRDAINVYDKGRTLLKNVYAMRKKDIPPLTGGEAMSISNSAMVIPRDEFNKKIEELLPYLEERKAEIKTPRPRILLSSDLLDNPAYVDLVEEVGCLVAMDDMDTGSRYFWETVGDGTEDPVYLLAKRYLNNRLPRMVDWDRQTGLLIEWVREYNIDGVVDFTEIYDHTREFRRSFMEHRLEEAGIPAMSFEREYHLASTGQLKTRVGAFLEMLGNKSAV
jgi:benzoyl-CoA reductase/2-hydroxyglutaryl-CoA dehydratase subunit BcrC/BadD/HgdB